MNDLIKKFKIVERVAIWLTGSNTFLRDELIEYAKNWIVENYDTIIYDDEAFLFKKIKYRMLDFIRKNGPYYQGRNSIDNIPDLEKGLSYDCLNHQGIHLGYLPIFFNILKDKRLIEICQSVSIGQVLSTKDRVHLYRCKTHPQVAYKKFKSYMIILKNLN